MWGRIWRKEGKKVQKGKEREKEQETGRRRTRAGSGRENKAKASVNRLRARPAAEPLQKERARVGRSAEED